MKSTITTLLAQLNHGLVEREDTLKAALLAVLAGENLLLIGPPGTGKSMIARRIADILSSKGEDRSYFEYLLTKFSTPEEIFGPLSISELKRDCFKRNTAGYLPSVRIGFLDEIFKASSSILNALLTILNERIYHNGAQAEHVPLQSLIAASNELPADQEELAALYDRFLMRRFVDYVSPANLKHLFEIVDAASQDARLSVEDVHRVQEVARNVAIPMEVREAVQRIWARHKEMFKEDRRESLSDRRLTKLVRLLRVSAASNEREAVDLSDVFLLKDCLWNHPDNAVKVRELVMETLRSCSRMVPLGDGDGAASPPPPPYAPGVVLKGFEGSGTEADPFLVRNMHQLMDLSRPEVGGKGHHFRQTADIDCTALGSWMEIAFLGHYDGAGHTIRYRRTGENWQALFTTVLAQSSVRNLDLLELHLAETVVSSRIFHCRSTTSLVKVKAGSSTLSACTARGSLVGGSAVACTITQCQSTSFLVRNLIDGGMVQDCAVDFDLVWSSMSNYRYLGGICSTVSNGGIVERCFVSGRIRNATYIELELHGITHKSYGATVRQCALGPLDFQGLPMKLGSRISFSTGTMSNNVSIDSNPGGNVPDGSDGRTVPAALFTQHYFEHTLDWDFDTTWQWDEGRGKPVLRQPGLDAALARPSPTLDAGATVDLLTQQMRANVWA